MSWGEVAIEDIAHVKGGKRLPSGHDFIEGPTPHPYIQVRDIGDGKVRCDQPVFLSEDTHSRIARYTVDEGDVVITIVGANVGDVGYISDEFSGANLTENAAKLVVDRSKCDPLFLKFLLATKASKEKLAFVASGAAQGKLGLYKIKSFSIPLPPLAVQQRIASIACNYDDLIENNRRRIALLEQAARLLYREWFVHFRFPGHETAKPVDGLPEGWLMKPLNELAHMTMGQSPKSEFYNAAGDGLPFHQGVTNYGFRFVEDKMFSTVTTKLAEAGDILFSVRAPVGRINYTLNKMVLGRGLSAFRSRSGHQSFLFYALKSHFFKEDLIGGGAIYAATNKKELEALEVLCPSKDMVAAFDQKAVPIDGQIKALSLQNRHLTAARDLLLPRLMDGRIPV